MNDLDKNLNDKHAPVVRVAHFYFGGFLNEHLPTEKRNCFFPVHFNGTPSVRNVIHSLSIPHSEIGAIKVNDISAGFDYRLQGSEHVLVQPAKAGQLASPAPVKFVVDVNLGKLAYKLRLLGFDTLFRNNLEDEEIVMLAEKQNRTVLTRDKGILTRNRVVQGYWLRSSQPREQLSEVVDRLMLADKMKPFSRCTICNGYLIKATGEALQKLDSETASYYDEFWECSNCGKLYWKGTHYGHILKLIKELRSAGDS